MVTLASGIKREDLVKGIESHAKSAYDELGGGIAFANWPLLIGSTAAPELLLDRLFLYAFAVEQVKRARGGHILLPIWNPEARRRYWLTVHWPPETGQASDPYPYLAEGTQHVGQDLGVGDLVWIFESKTGRDREVEEMDGTKHPVVYEDGRRGVIGLSQIVGQFRTIDVRPETYKDGTEKWWRWQAPARFIRTSGFIPHEKVNEILGYSPTHSLRGFGTAHSGLLEIDQQKHGALLSAYLHGTQRLPQAGPPSRQGGPGGEGPEHRALKEKIAANPASVLGESGLTHVATEFGFQSGDRADIILGDAFGRFIGVEVEVEVDLADLSGVLQAIKYPRMYTLVAQRPFSEGRSFLVAHKISDEVKTLCRKYEVECFEVAR